MAKKCYHKVKVTLLKGQIEGQKSDLILGPVIIIVKV